MSSLGEREEILRRLRKQEADWMQTGRRHNLVLGCLGLVFYLVLLNRIHSTIVELPMATADDIKLGSMFVFALSVLGTILTAQGLLSAFSIVQAWRYWNGNLIRRGVIASLEGRDSQLVHAFSVVIERDGEIGLYVASVPGWPGAHTQGTMLDELQSNLQEVIKMLLDDGEEFDRR